MSSDKFPKTADYAARYDLPGTQLLRLSANQIPGLHERVATYDHPALGKIEVLMHPTGQGVWLALESGVCYQINHKAVWDAALDIIAEQEKTDG